MAAFVLLLGVACSSGSKAGPASPGSGETHDAAGEKTAALTSQPVARPSGELSVAGVVKLAEPAVVKITTSTGVGSGFVVDEDGYIITNNHVIAGLSGRPSTSITVIMSDGAEYRASVVGADPRSDI
ncbi:hypothetical protein EDM76_12570, partial [bacterium]